MPAVFRAIKSTKRVPANKLAQVENLMRQFERDGVNKVSRYPPQRPTVSGYRRTGKLGQSWSRETNTRRHSGGVRTRVLSAGAVAPYNVLVVGPERGRRGRRQTREMARRGWPTAPEFLTDLWERSWEPRIDATLQEPFG